MRLDTFTKNNILMFCANSLGSFFNLLYQIVMLRLLSKDAFAGLNSIISLLIIISVPVAAFSAMVTKHISSHNARKKTEHLKTVWQVLAFHALLFSLVIFAVIFLLRYSIAGFLHLDSVMGIVILGAIFFCSGIASLVIGGFQGLEQFKWLAALTVGGGLLKLLLSAGLVKRIPHALDAALLGFLLPILLSIVISAWPLRFLLRGRGRERIDVPGLYAYILPVSAVGLCFALLTNVDMLLVKHFFIKEAQDYAVAQMIGKIILSISGMVYIIMFSRVANLHAVNASSREILTRSLYFTFYLSFLAAAAFNIFPGFCFGMLAGSVSPEVILLGRVFSLSMLFFALSNVLFFYQLSVERFQFIIPLAIIGLLEMISIWVFHSTPLHVAGITLVCSVTVFLLNLKSAFHAAR